EKIGFPDEYRAGAEAGILRDIAGKLGLERARGRVVLDIGPGCSELPRMISALCAGRGHQLLLVDSPEMLAQLPDDPHVTKFAGRYPDIPELFSEHRGSLDAVLAYSVVQYVFAEGDIWDFLDRSLELLAPGAAMLLGDVPNVSKRKRFFASAAGVAHHRRFT